MVESQPEDMGYPALSEKIYGRNQPVFADVLKRLKEDAPKAPEGSPESLLPLKIVYLRRKRKGRYVENNDELVDFLRKEVEYLKNPERFLGRKKTNGELIYLPYDFEEKVVGLLA